MMTWLATIMIGRSIDTVCNPSFFSSRSEFVVQRSEISASA